MSVFLLLLLFCLYHASLPLKRLCHLNHSRIISMFSTGGGGILTQEDSVTADGLQEIFTTNLFGHFLLVSHGEPCKILLSADKEVCTAALRLIRQIQLLLYQRLWSSLTINEMFQPGRC